MAPAVGVSADPDVMLETRGLSREFSGFVAVNNVNLKVRRGTIHALIGPNGAGKTTCFNLISKFLRPSAGRISYKGRDVTAVPCFKMARLGMVRSFQISAIFPGLTTLENVRIGLQRSAGTSYHFWKQEKSLANLDARACELLDTVGLLASARRPAGELPYGAKRALEIATTLALDPELLLLDEPMAGMPHEDIPRISRLIRQVAQSRTVLMVEHNMSVVADLCDRITVLARGEVVSEGSYRDISRHDKVIEVYLGSSTVAGYG
jgi:branched-chain amino acid transport system ATP-binding protein